jgi:hypothetical protein
MKERKMMLKQPKDKVMTGVLRKNIKDNFPLNGDGNFKEK